MPGTRSKGQSGPRLPGLVHQTRGSRIFERLPKWHTAESGRRGRAMVCRARSGSRRRRSAKVSIASHRRRLRVAESGMLDVPRHERTTSSVPASAVRPHPTEFRRTAGQGRANAPGQPGQAVRRGGGVSGRRPELLCGGEGPVMQHSHRYAISCRTDNSIIDEFSQFVTHFT